jgi:hypothetical protein
VMLAAIRFTSLRSFVMFQVYVRSFERM